MGANDYWSVASGSATVASNWSLNMVPGSSDAIMINNGGECIVADGDALSVDALRVGYRNSASNRVVQTGGTVAAAGDIYVSDNDGSQNTASGYYHLQGGTLTLGSGRSIYISRYTQSIGYMEVSGTGVFDASAGNIVFGIWTASRSDVQGEGILRLSPGGTVKVRSGADGLRLTSPNGKILFNGGVMQFTADKATFLNNASVDSGAAPVFVEDGGAVFDTQGYAVTINAKLQAADGATGGGLVKRGAGTLTLSAANSFKGDVVVEEGTLSISTLTAIPTPGETKITVKSGATLAFPETLTDAEKAAVLSSLVNEGGTVTGLDGVDPSTLATFATPNADITIPTDITASSGTKTGDYSLTLTGNNDFGGQFTVNGGTLSADFGQGVAATDNVLLNSGYGSFASPSGLVTAGLGTDAGQIQFLSGAIEGFANPYADTTLTVRLFGDASHTLTYGSDEFNPSRFVLNHGKAKGPIVFENPVTIPSGKTFEVFNGGNSATPVFMTGAISGAGTFKKHGGSSVTMPLSSTAAGVNVTQGTLLFPEGGTVSATASFVANGGKIVVSNATSTINCDLDAEDNSTIEFVGGTLKQTVEKWNYQRKSGKLVFDGVDADFTGNAKTQLYLGRENRNDKSSLVVRNGAKVKTPTLIAKSGTMEISGDDTEFTSSEIKLGGWHNLGAIANISTIMESEILVSGGTMTVNGDIRMASSTNSTVALRVSGGKVKFPGTGKSLAVGHCGDATLEVSGTGLVELTGTDGVVMTPSWGTGGGYMAGRTRGAVRLLAGGTIHTPQLYAGYNNRDNSVAFDGGTLELDNGSFATLFDKVVTRYVGVNGGAIDTDWSHTASGPFVALTNQTAATVATADFASTPAFTKKGTGTLTLKGANTYTCATAVDEGTLALASGATLPGDAIVRLGGGTLDLGGNTLTVRALTGSGSVKNGKIVATEGVYPGNPGTIGTISLDATATIEGTVYVDVSGAECDKIAAAGAVDLGAIPFVFADGAEPSRETTQQTILTAGSLSGSLSATNTPRKFRVFASNSSVHLAQIGFIVVIR